jgi:hypothetical protein
LRSSQAKENFNPFRALPPLLKGELEPEISFNKGNWGDLRRNMASRAKFLKIFLSQ